MSAPKEDGREPSPVDAAYVENLDALTRDLTDLEELAAAALAEEPLDQATAQRLGEAPTGLTYKELTDHNRQRRETEAWGEAAWADILDPAALRQLDE